ncbi:holo-ACP synthase [Candidatus Magnetomonas plexicatena]|uniref:holo-ACP synthase n=1 Tax=Candidatus Magnetomonas plexicatena TaxID=2552947 RepID=UPI001C748EC0|nr:holo-[acyl-carrier-protein] synthase [Nitrospirales bacterium LBB_01]
MVLHQGIDIVNIPKFTEFCVRHAAAMDDIFTANEIASSKEYRRSADRLAGRFAAKEACLKALGIGFTGSSAFGVLKQVEIKNKPSGKPEITLHGFVMSVCKRKNINGFNVSISHSGDYAVSMVTLTEE